MHNRGAVARLIAAAVCCLSVMLYSGYRYIFSLPAGTSLISTPSLAGSEVFPALFAPENTVQSESKENTASAPQAAQSQGAVPTAAAENAAGKIVSKFISPYTANTSYGSIYLKNSTDAKIDIKSLYEAPLPYTIEKNGSPQVLIMHTHTTESFLTETRDYYTDSDQARTLDENYNMAALGAIVAEKLNAAGISTLHDKTTHDYPSYNGSYTRAAQTIDGYLKKYPSIKIVIDLHRDAISGDGSGKVKPVTEINGKQAAQIMLVMGSQTGGVTGFKNWQENLKLAVKLQRQLEGMYPSLARALSLMSRKYNENLTTGSMLIEIGTEVNSIEEVRYSAELLGNALAQLLAQ